MSPDHARTFGRRSGAASRALALPRPGWKTVGVLALLCSGVAWASLPRANYLPSDEQHQWQALGLAPLSSGGATGMRMAETDEAQPVAFVPHRTVQPLPAVAPAAAVIAANPLRITGRVGDGLYWSLRAAGANPEVAAQYLAALATEIDVGEVAPNASFDLVLGAGANLLYAGLSGAGEHPLQLVKWSEGGAGEDWSFNFFSHGPQGCPGAGLSILLSSIDELSTLLRHHLDALTPVP